MQTINFEFLNQLSKIPDKDLTWALKIAKGKNKYPSTIKDAIKKIYL